MKFKKLFIRKNCVFEFVIIQVIKFSRWKHCFLKFTVSFAHVLFVKIIGLNYYYFHSYRLAPEYHFPIQFEDVYDALKWFLRQDVLEKYGVDPERVGVSGDSAGGNLAAAVAQKVWCSDLFYFKNLHINILISDITIPK